VSGTGLGARVYPGEALDRLLWPEVTAASAKNQNSAIKKSILHQYTMCKYINNK
jgi:hypothetical protein